jgi:CspA family cold shock protein
MRYRVAPKGPGDRAFFVFAEGIPMATGKVRFYNEAKGFGIITPDVTGPTLFMHQSSIRSPGVKKLKASQRVEFDVENRPEGLTATNIKMLA